MKLYKLFFGFALLAVLSNCGDQEEASPDEQEGASSLVWERYFISAIDNGPMASVRRILYDNDQNIYVIGAFRDKISFNLENQDDFSLLLQTQFDNNRDGFVLKLDQDGNSVWAKSYPTPINDFFYDAVLQNDKLYVSGSKSSLVWILDKDGNELAGSTNGDPDSGYTDLIVGANGSVFFTGFIRDGFGHYHNQYGELDDQGAVVWSKEFKLGDNFELISKIQQAANGDLYIAGNAGTSSVFINRLTETGDSLWSKSLDAEMVRLEQLLITTGGQLFVAGKFTGSKSEGLGHGIDLDPGDGVQRFLSTSQGYDQFMVLLTADGDYIWGDDIYSTGLNVAFLSAAEIKGKILMSFNTYAGVSSGEFFNIEQLIEENPSHDGFMSIDPTDGHVEVYNFQDNKDYPAAIPYDAVYLPDGDLVYAKFIYGLELNPRLLISKQKY
ncbi:MAG: hypothetical protein RIA69_20335 [Cyclobacteriaceae bacterium]